MANYDRAKAYRVTGDLIPAAETERIGLANDIVPAGDPGHHRPA